jgi:(S)-ureidoglycine-glyoxylate aminotransferase
MCRVLGEGLEARFARHAAAGRAVVTGARAMGLTVFGDDAYRMTNMTGIVIRDGVDGEHVRRRMCDAPDAERSGNCSPLSSYRPDEL